MPSNVSEVSIRFPDLTPAEAAQLAQECRREFLAAGAASSSIRIARTDAEAMDLGGVLVLAAGGSLLGGLVNDLAKDFAKGAAHKAGSMILEWLCRKYGTRAEICDRGKPVTRIGHAPVKTGMSRSDHVMPPQNLSRLGVIILGASTYPGMEGLDNSAFARSANAARELFSPARTVFRDVAVLDLFDKDLGTAAIVDSIDEFLSHETDLNDLLIYYCGHGSFLKDRTYFLTLRGTRLGRESTTGLKLRDLRHDLEHHLVDRRLYVVLDCCFSGEAVKEFQFDATGAGRLVEGQVYDAMPATGWAVLTASSASMPAIAPKGEDLTMFTGALTSVLSDTSDGSPSRLTLSDLIAEANQVIRRKHGLKAVTPQCHVPRQDSGDVSRIPLFVRGIPGPEPIAPGLSAPSAKLSDEQVQQLIDDGLRVGRNEACPCGSGRKFKHCHGRFE